MNLKTARYVSDVDIHVVLCAVDDVVVGVVGHRMIGIIDIHRIVDDAGDPMVDEDVGDGVRDVDWPCHDGDGDEEGREAKDEVGRDVNGGRMIPKGLDDRRKEDGEEDRPFRDDSGRSRKEVRRYTTEGTRRGYAGHAGHDDVVDDKHKVRRDVVVA